MADKDIFLDAVTAIKDKFEADYTGSLPLVWENDDAQDLTITSGFIQFSVQFLDSQFATINAGSPLNRTRGTANFDIFTAINKGPGEGLAEVGLVAKIFRGQEFGSMIFYAPDVLSAQTVKRPQGRFWNTPLACPFQQDVKVTIS